MGVGFRLDELARRVGGSVIGDGGRQIRGVATLDEAGPDDLGFLTNPRYRRAAGRTRAGALLVGPGATVEGRDLLVARQPYLALAAILELFHATPPAPRGVSPDARVSPGARLGAAVSIGPFAVVERDAVLGERVVIGAGSIVGEACTIGDDTVLKPRVVAYPGTRIGARCLVHSGVVLGADGFGFATSEEGHRKVPQVGRVVIEDDVEIGANTTVDRAALGDTVVGRGTKIDDLVMVAHGSRIGPHGLLAAQTGISGSTIVGARVTFAGQSGAAGHLAIGEGSVVAAKAAVLADVPAGSFVAGIPAVDHRLWKRAQAALKRLPDLLAEVRSLRARVAALESDPRRKDP